MSALLITAGASLAAAPAFAQAAAAKIDAADTAWMISATGLVLMMTIPGLALFYAGMVRKKNVLATMAQSLAATMLGSILWFWACTKLKQKLGNRHGARLRQVVFRAPKPRLPFDEAVIIF
jgi:ammonia channel protein AmtB